MTAGWEIAAVDAALENLLLELADGAARHLTKEPMVANIQPPVQYPHRWRWWVRLLERRGQSCRITARGTLNSIRVEFANGFWVITSRWALRRAR